MTPDDVALVFYGSALAAGLILGAFVALFNSWTP